VILASFQYAAYHNSCIYLFLFVQRIFRNIPVEFPQKTPTEKHRHITVVWHFYPVKGV